MIKCAEKANVGACENFQANLKKLKDTPLKNHKNRSEIDAWQE
jgi:hypothetical protein